MKKILSILLIAVILSSFVISIVAVEPANAVYEVDGEYFDNFDSALSAATSKPSSYMKLLKDTSISKSGVVIPEGASIVFDLNGKTFTNTATAYFIDSIKGDLTVKNGTMNVNRGMVVNNGGHLILDGLTYTVVATGTSARPAVKLNGAGTTKLTVKNSYVKTYGPGESLILVEHSTDGIINLIDNSTLEFAGTLTGNPQNCGAVAIQQAWGGVDSNLESSNTDLVLNVEAGSSIITSAQSSSTASQVAACIAVQTKGEVEINLAEGANMVLDRTPGSSSTCFINPAITYTPKSLVINDNGANWKASKGVQAAGFKLPDVAKSGEIVVGWMKNGKMLKPVETYTDKSATETVSLRAVTFEKSDFVMQDGASLRTADGERGIRFSTTVSESLVKLLGDRAVFGTLIAPSRFNPNLYTGETVDIKASIEKFAPENGYITYRAAVIMPDDVDDKSAYGLTMSAIAYMTVTYDDGTTATFNTEFDSENVRSIKTVAHNLKSQGYTSALIEHIIKIFEGGVNTYDSAVLVGFCTENSLYNGAFNSSVGWTAAGMGYIIRTQSGRLIVVDGGNTADSEEFFKRLQKYAGSENVTVDYWIFTHAHGDHVNSFIGIAESEEMSAKLTVKNLVYNFPEDFRDSGCKTYKLRLDGIAADLGANVITPAKDQLIVLEDALIRFYYVPVNYSSYNTPNQISLIFSVEVDKKVMFTGDAYVQSLTKVSNEYSTDDLKSDILQMPHHFLCDTGYKPFYEKVDAESVMLPTCIAGYNAMYNNSSYYNSSYHKANDWAAQNAEHVYKAFDGDFEILI